MKPNQLLSSILFCLLSVGGWLRAGEQPLISAIAPLRAVSGVVLDEGNAKPISGALVRVSSPAMEMRSVRDHRDHLYDGRTDANGHFTIQVPAGETISLNAFAAGYEEAAGPWMSGNRTFDHLPFPTDGKEEFTIKLKPALYVAGIVADEAGRPLAGVKVEATLADKNGMSYLAWDETDEGGRFETFDFPLDPPLFNGNSTARGQVTFADPTKLRNTIENVYALNATGRTNLHVTLRAGHDVKGILTSADGQPLAGTEVEAIPSDKTAAPKMDSSDARGQFLIRGLPDGEITVRAHSSKFEQKAQTVVHLAGAGVAVNLQLTPVILQNPPKAVSLFGMKLADVTPELQAAYDLTAPTGILILDPGTNSIRLGIGAMSQGERFWMAGNKEVSNLREMAAELLRLGTNDPPGDPNKGYRGSVRVVYDLLRGAGTDTEYIKLTDDDIAELKKLVP
jgi:hypothetical protein